MKTTAIKSQASAKKGDPKDSVKSKADLAVAQIRKQFGDGSIMRLGDGQQQEGIEIVSTGSLSLDVALGVGGVPRGRVVEIFGPEGSGKTTLAQSIIAKAQRSGGIAAFIDAEHAFDVVYSRKLGVDVDNLLVSQPDTGEQALDIVEVLVRSGAIDVIVVDSVAALVPRAEIEGEMGDSHVGLQARLMSQALRKLAGVVSKTNTCVIFINQIRMKIGVMFGNPETTTGGNALKFYSSVRLDIRRVANLKDGDDIVGNRTKVKVVKNKVAPPFRIAEFDIIYGEGISYLGDVVDLGVAANVIDKSGTWLSYGEEKIGQGRERAKQFLRENPKILREIDAKIRAHHGLPMPGGSASSGQATATAKAEDAPAPPTNGDTPQAAARGRGRPKESAVRPAAGR
ncbi:MAG: recombinase RecA [Candidatus Latescibacterota bacterium]|nr:MAG: recombinase RecA [Candidatus Latescibacterota bacterium]